MVLGRHSQNGVNVNEATRGVAEVINHPYYDYFTIDNDISLLRLSAPVQFDDFISPVCLAKARSVIYPNTSSWVTGWGVTSDGKLPG